MKTELLVFEEAVILAHQDGVISKSDCDRMINGIRYKGIGFVADLDGLAQCIREGLAVGTFQLTEHLNKVFRRPSKRTALPVFLLGLLSEIFHLDGKLRESFDAHLAATVITLLSALKRIDPPKSHSASLEAKVWTDLESNFNDSDEVKDRVLNTMHADHIRGIRAHFQRLCPPSIGEPELAYGPGANIERIPSSTSSDWILADPDGNVPEPLREYYQSLIAQSRYAPTIGRKRVTVRLTTDCSRMWYVDKLSLRRPVLSYPDVNIMHCSAQPKSYKAYRGVGVMHASRMALQLSLQRYFYRWNSCPQLPLRSQAEMSRNLVSSPLPVGTGDASSASDRKYWWLLDLFGMGNLWYEACRSVRTRVLRLPTKFIECKSPVMGEAITFPLMSVYYAAVALYVCDVMGGGHESVRIYGDDIQTPHYEETLSLLTFLGDKISTNKSYPPDSAFKESCEAHFIWDPITGNPVDSRPAFIPSGRLYGNVRRGHISRSDTYKLLILAKDAFYRSAYVAHAAIAIVKRYSIPNLPKVQWLTGDLGEPTYTSKSRYELVPIRKRTVTHTLTPVGSARQALRDPQRSLDQKLAIKLEHKIAMAEIQKYQVTDSFDRLEYHVLCYVLTEWDKYLTANSTPSQRGRGHIMHADVIANNPKSNFRDVLGYLRSVVRNLPEGFVDSTIDRLIAKI